MYAAPLILLAQNRQDDRDRVQIEQDRQRAERNLADLISMGVFDRRFDKKLAALHALVRAHAEREEREEFPLLRREIPPDQLRRMASELRATLGELP